MSTVHVMRTVRIMSLSASRMYSFRNVISISMMSTVILFTTVSQQDSPDGISQTVLPRTLHGLRTARHM